MVDAACRFDADAVDGVLAALPADPALLERWVWDPLEPATRLWLTLQLAEADADRLHERRLLFTPLVWAIALGRLSDANTIEANGAKRWLQRWFQLAGAARGSRNCWHLGHHGAGASRP